MYSVATYREVLTGFVNQLRTTAEVALTSLLSPTSVGVRTVASTVRAGSAVPAFANAQMDGFAVRAADFPSDSHHPVHARLQAMAPAGHEPAALEPGMALPVMTGSKMPAGSDCNIPVEETAAGFSALDWVEFLPGTEFSTGRFVRPPGSDVRAGDIIAQAGDVLTPALVGVLASTGLSHVPIYQPLRIAVVSTGDEVVAPGMERGPAQIFDANSYTLSRALQQAGAHVVAHVHVPDSAVELFTRIDQLCADPTTRPDLVVSSGGISKGAREVIRMAAELAQATVPPQSDQAPQAGQSSRAARSLQADMNFVSVALQPGGPQAYGFLAGLPWIALPGNPVSGLVSIEMFVRPALLGKPAHVTPRPVIPAPLRTSAQVTSPAGKLQVRRARLGADGAVEFVGGPSSHLLGDYAAANALALVPEDQTLVSDGDVLNVFIINNEE